MFTNDFWVAIGALFVNGCCCSVRIQIGYLYMMEFMPKKNQAFAGTLYFMLEVAVGLLGVLYFSCISTHWFDFLAVGYVLLLIGTACSFCIPESPKFLFMKGMYERSSEAL